MTLEMSPEPPACGLVYYREFKIETVRTVTTQAPIFFLLFQLTQ